MLEAYLSALLRDPLPTTAELRRGGRGGGRRLDAHHELEAPDVAVAIFDGRCRVGVDGRRCGGPDG